VHDLRQIVGTEGLNHEVDVIRHYAPRECPVAFVVEVANGVVHDFCVRRIAKKALAVAHVQEMIELIEQFIVTLFNRQRLLIGDESDLFGWQGVG